MASTTTTKASPTRVYRYNICNGLSNQFLYHAASIAKAAAAAAASEEVIVVEVPDYFLFNGVQTTSKDVLPNPQNAISFGAVLDAPYFVQQVEKELHNLKVVFVTFHDDSKKENHRKAAPKCAGMSSLVEANPRIVQQVLSFFQPSAEMRRILEPISQQLVHNNNNNNNNNHHHAMCLHHRDGQDWHDHCERWSAIPDGIYRGNCLLPPNETLVQALQSRTIMNRNNSHEKWIIYYCGDHGIPSELHNHPVYQVVSRADFLSEEGRQAVLQLATPSSPSPTLSSSNKTGAEVRDLWALIDFLVCAHADNDNNNDDNRIRFVGNSVSTFSALQIALRHNNQGAYWYNSQSIPLAGMWPVYQIPIVYYIDERNNQQQQQPQQELYALQASMASIQAQMPESDIHLFYRPSLDNGSMDLFESWVQKQQQQQQSQHVTFHRLPPKSPQQGGSDSGISSPQWMNDIANIMDTEYCLVLNIHALVKRPFTLADFGLNVTRTMATATGNTQELVDGAGPTTLINVPYLRRLQQQQQVEENVDMLSPDLWSMPHQVRSDKEAQEALITDFTPAAPAEYLRLIMGANDDNGTDACATASSSLLRRAFGDRSIGSVYDDEANNLKSLFCGKIDRRKNRLQQVRRSLQVFARHIPDSMAYCQAVFGSSSSSSSSKSAMASSNSNNQQFQAEGFVLFCHEILQALLLPENQKCRDFPSLVLDQALPKALSPPPSLQQQKPQGSWRAQSSLPERWIVSQRLGVSSSRSSYFSSLWSLLRDNGSMGRLYTISMTSWLVFTLLFIKCQRARRKKRGQQAPSMAVWSIPVLLWAIMSFSLPHWLIY